MNEPISYAELRAAIELIEAEKKVRPWAVEFRAQDKATLIHALNEPPIRRADEWSPWAVPLGGVPFFIDEDIPAGVVRMKMSDGTERDL